MFSDKKVDYLPFDNKQHADPLYQQLNTIQKRKWQVLAGTFLLAFILAAIFIWSRPSLYQSQAILQFTAANPMRNTESSFLKQSLQINKQRLKSDNVILALSDYLRETFQIDVSYPELIEILNVEMSESGNILTLEARGQEATYLKYIVDSWSTNYIRNLERESQTLNSDEVSAIQTQLLGLESKIEQQRHTIESYAGENQIISEVRDENQILNKIKGLGNSLELAENDKNQALVDIERLNSAVQAGDIILNPKDLTSIEAKKAKLQLLNDELKALDNQYTQEYLARDPLIVAKQKSKKELDNALKQQINESQISYLQDSQRNLEAAANKVVLIRQQLNQQRDLAQKFNQKLAYFKNLNAELEELQLQKQTLKNQLTDLELAKPLEVRVTVLEPANRAEYPIGPNNWRDTFFAFIVSAGLALLALFIYGYIVRPKTINRDTPNVVIVPQYASSERTALTTHNQQIENQTSSQPILALHNTPNLRILETNECKALYNAANNQGKVLIGLSLCGVGLDEIVALQSAQFVLTDNELHLNSGQMRKVVIPQAISNLLNPFCDNTDVSKTLWSGAKVEADFNEILINTAYDADIALPDNISVSALRHTYIKYLVDQGLRLNQVELICGSISPSILSHFRQAKKLATNQDVDAVQTIYPFITA